MTTRKTKALQPTETLSIPSQEETTVLDLPSPSSEPSTLIQAAIERQEQELTALQTRMDALGDDFADRAEAIVLQGLERAYRKAQNRILSIEVPGFFGSSLPRPVLPQASEVTLEC